MEKGTGDEATRLKVLKEAADVSLARPSTIILDSQALTDKELREKSAEEVTLALTLALTLTLMEAGARGGSQQRQFDMGRRKRDCCPSLRA